MIRIGNLPLEPGEDWERLRQKAARALGLRPGQLGELAVVRQSIDARRKDQVHYVYTVELFLPHEERLIRAAPGRNVTLVTHTPYVFPAPARRPALPPVVVGMGPAGLFAALFLARAGIPCVLLERGRPVEERTRDVERFWATGQLSRTSNVQFGEGGAGTFSDGKLTTGTHDPRISAVLDALVEFGAPEDVKWSHKPQHRHRRAAHRGTKPPPGAHRPGLRRAVRAPAHRPGGPGGPGVLRNRGKRTGRTGRAALRRPHPGPRPLRPGHLRHAPDAGVPMEAKPFAIGVRVEHRQRDISLSQYGPAWERLPPSDYKLACHLPSGRSAFTFCVCPGGQVGGRRQRLRPGGHQRHEPPGPGRGQHQRRLPGWGDARRLPGDDVLSGVRFQETWERAAFQAGGGDFRAPAQRAEDFLARRPSEGPGGGPAHLPPGVTWTGLDPCLPPYVADTLRGALPLLDRKLHGFADPDAVLTGVETRSSSPVRILRDEGCQSALRGLVPLRRGGGLRRGHRVRRRGRHPGGRGGGEGELRV